MNNYILVNEEEKKKIFKIEVKESFTMSQNNIKATRIKNIEVYDKKVLSKLAQKDLIEKYKRLKAMIKLLEDNDSDDDTPYANCISELDYILGLIKFKYNKFLKKEARNLFIDKLMKDRKLLMEGYELKNDNVSHR